MLPILIPFLMAILSIINWGNRVLHRFLALAGSVGLLFAALALLTTVNEQGILSSNIGDWPAPFGIVLVADLPAAIMILMAAIVGLAVLVYASVSMDKGRERFGYYPLILLLLMGMCGAFLTGDLFNLYVWFEIMLIASFALLALGGSRAQLEGSVKYFALNLLVSAFMLTGIGLLYGMTGSLNLAALAQTLRAAGPEQPVTTVAIFFMIAFGIKAAMFPLYFWLPASYHTPPVAVSAIFAGLLTKVGVFALIRVFTLLFVQDTAWTHGLLLAGAALTMLSGVLGAMAFDDIRRIFAFHIISQIAYMVLGLALFVPMALAGTIFYMVHHILVIVSLFLVSGLIARAGGSYFKAQLGGLYGTRPLLALLFLVPALSLSGVPPLSGFWAKLTLLRVTLARELWLVAAIALLVGLLTLFSMVRIWLSAFWGPPGPAAASVTPMRVGERRALYGSTLALVTLTLALSLFAGPAFELAERASEQLLDPAGYIAAVLGEGS
ncbi:MAG: proton-conducting transporter membrane subunit [Anaerolineaceae bacterium]|nr:proton-conducting transporter membrane subunit [Anaerolineaceae bacterium]